MKILFVIPEEYEGERRGGVTTSTITLASALTHLGHDISILTPGHANRQTTQKRIHIIKITRLPYTSLLHKMVYRFFEKISYEIFDRLRWAETVASFIKTHPGFDIIEAPEWGSSTLFLPFQKSLKIVVRLHRSWLQYNQDNHLPITLSLRVLDIFERFCIASASAVTSPTHFMLAQYPLIHVFLRIRHTPVSIIPYGVTIQKK